MTRGAAHTLGDAIRAFLKNNSLEEKLAETRIRVSWEKAVGRNIARYTDRLTLKNGVLTVYLSSSVLRNELHHSREKIRGLINREVGEAVVHSLVFR